MPDTVLTGSFTVADGTGGVTPPAGSVLDLGTEGNPAVSIDLEGTFVATFVIEATSEAGPATDWFTPVVLNAAGVASSATLTAAGRRFLSAAGIGRVRLRCTAFTSGAPTATLRAGQGFVSAGGGGGGGGAVTVADGADIAQGTTTDAGIITNASGTVIGFLRGAIIQWAAFLSRLPAALVGGRLDVNIGATAVTQPVSGTVTANAGTGTLAVSAATLPLPTGAAADASIGTTNTQVGGLTETAPATDIASSGLNGRLQRVAQRLSSLIALLPAALVGGRLDVNLGAAPATVAAQGDVAHGATDAGNPVKHGAIAIAHGTNPTAVTAAQRTSLYANRAGVPFVVGGHPNVQTIGVNYTAAQTDTAIVTVATGLKIVVTGFLVTCHNANTVNVSARLGFGTVNTPAYGAAGLIGTHPGIAAGSGFGRGGGAGIVGVGADDADLRFTCSVPTSGSIDVTVSYYTIES